MSIEGIQYFDGLTESTFTLHAHILSLSGNIPAFAKVMYTTGYNSYKACQFYTINEVYYCQENRHVYFPHKSADRRYDPENLPLRTHEGYIQDVIAIEHVNGTLYRQEVQKRGEI